MRRAGREASSSRRAVFFGYAGRERFVIGAPAVSPILAFIASMNARTFGDGSRVDGYTA